MQHLIYMLCFGSPVYAEMTRLCVRSLRTAGRYNGDIIVFGDGGFSTTEPGVRVIDVGKLRDPFAIKCFKSAAMMWIDPNRYTRIAVMDIDMLAIADIAPLFDHDDDRVHGMTEQPFNTMLADACGGALLRLDEREVASTRWGINTGFLSMSPAIYTATMTAWRRAIGNQRELANYWADQPFFNTLVLRGHVAFDSYPHGWIDMPPMYRWFNGELVMRPQTTLLHLCGDDKHECLARMRAGAQALGEGVSIAELGRRITAITPRSGARRAWSSWVERARRRLP